MTFEGADGTLRPSLLIRSSAVSAFKPIPLSQERFFVSALLWMYVENGLGVHGNKT